MFYVYVLRSNRNTKRYVGYTGKQVSVRVSEHNSGSSQFTRQNGPFELKYEESYQSKKEAMKRERFLKSGQGRKFLDNLNV